MARQRPARAFTPIAISFSLALAAAGCAHLPDHPPTLPSVAPGSQPSASLQVDRVPVPTMYRELLSIDLPTVLRVTVTSNLDIKEAQQRLEFARGAYDASLGALVPSVSPNITQLGIEGAVSAPKGGFQVDKLTQFTPAILLNWIINPGQVAYDVIASKRRLEASAHQEQAVLQQTTRTAANQYYDLALTQAEVSVAHQAVDEAQELLRIERLKLKTGTGLPADELRAEAALAAANQDLISAINAFYNASIALAVTLHLDASVMLVPDNGTLIQTTLVREDTPIDDMLTTAVRYRPDLAAVRSALAAAQADRGASFWGGLGPRVQAAGTIEPAPPARIAADTMYRQQQYNVSAGFNWSAASYGRIKSAVANAHIAGLNLDRQLDEVHAAVVSAHQASLAHAQLVPNAKQQVTAAEEALRLTQQDLEAGTALTIDVLQAEAAANQARSRYAAALVRYNQAQINLLAAMGLLDQNALQAVVPYGASSPKS
jgi:outer membrane protein TolC